MTHNLCSFQYVCFKPIFHFFPFVINTFLSFFTVFVLPSLSSLNFFKVMAYGHFVIDIKNEVIDIS